MKDAAIFSLKVSIFQKSFTPRTLKQPDFLLTVERYAEENIDRGDRAAFVEMVQDEIKRLHQGIIARYRFAAWQEMPVWRLGESCLDIFPYGRSLPIALQHPDRLNWRRLPTRDVHRHAVLRRSR